MSYACYNVTHSQENHPLYMAIKFNLLYLHFLLEQLNIFARLISVETNKQGNKQMQQVQIKSVKQGAIFSKREDGPLYIRNHYNRKDMFGPACFSVSRCDDMNSETTMKPTKLVWVD